MSRRPHWDDELIETVKNAIFRNCFDHVEGPLYDQDVFPVIAAVEDWQDANGFGRMGSLMRRLIDAEAAVERVREACEPFGPMGSIAVWRILRALDGDGDA